MPADPNDRTDFDAARTRPADVVTRLGYGCECGTWRNHYPTGAQELGGPMVTAMVSSAGMASALTITQRLGRRAGPELRDNHTLTGGERRWAW